MPYDNSLSAKSFGVRDVKIGATDPTECRVEEIYSKTDNYAVYRTSVRVAVQFSDCPTIADQQKQRVVPLNNLRTQITGLIDGWRNSYMRPLQRKARRYESRVAALLVIALDGDAATPSQALTELRSEICDERKSWGRFEYLISAFLVAVVAFLILTTIQKFVWPFKFERENLWLAGRAGALGAFFSIALAIQNRTILTNLRRRDNISDATLRVLLERLRPAYLSSCLVRN